MISPLQPDAGFGWLLLFGQLISQIEMWPNSEIKNFFFFFNLELYSVVRVRNWGTLIQPANSVVHSLIQI
jgi:hypothetical protein